MLAAGSRDRCRGGSRLPASLERPVPEASHVGRVQNPDAARLGDPVAFLHDSYRIIDMLDDLVHRDRIHGFVGDIRTLEGLRAPRKATMLRQCRHLGVPLDTRDVPSEVLHRPQKVPTATDSFQEARLPVHSRGLRDRCVGIIPPGESPHVLLHESGGKPDQLARGADQFPADM